MKIAVIGAGAIGSAVGGLLFQAGEDVTLIGRKPHVDLINRKGLILEGESGETLIRVRADEDLDFKPDLALLAVKTQDVETSVKRNQPYLSGATVLTMQNGVRADDLVAALLGEENIVSSVVFFNSAFLEPGKILYSVPVGKPALLIGEPFGANENRLQSLSALLNKALPTTVSEDIRGAHWTKLLWNLNTAVPAVTGLSMQEGSEHPQITELSIKLMKEGLEVIKLAGIKTAPIPGWELSLMEMLVNMPLQEASVVVKQSVRSLGEQAALGSVLQSIKRGRSTEIDYLNGEIVNLGKEKGILTPVNSFVVELVHHAETTGVFLTIDELTRRLRDVV